MGINENLLRELYVDKKMSAFEIARVLKCSENKVNYWIKKSDIRKRGVSEALYCWHNPNGDPFHLKEINTKEDAKLLGLGLGLYWGEGNKKNKNSIRLGNTDPILIKKFIDFLLDILGVKKEKIRFGLQVFSDIGKTRALNFWLNCFKKYGIKNEQFFKVTTTPARSIGTYRKKSQFGVLTVYFCNVKLKKILDSMLPL